MIIMEEPTLSFMLGVGYLRINHFVQGGNLREKKKLFYRALKKFLRSTNTGDRILIKDLVWCGGDPESPRSSCSRKFKYNGTIYTAPECVDYYIRELDYRPPDQVVEALIDKFGDLNLEDA